jgi:tryptophanyl-tRNA synthetase
MTKRIIDPLGGKEIKIDEKLFKEFGLKKFKESEKLNHYFFERNIIVAHRDFERINDAIKKKKPFLQMTGIASSGDFHLGHKVNIDQFLLFKKNGAKSFFGVCDIDAYIARPDNKVPSMKFAKECAVRNVADLLSLGLKKEEIYLQSKKESRYYEFSFEISKKITENTFRATYGHVEPSKVSANLLQYADILHGQLEEYYGPMPSITGIGIDQDPHARATRDIVKRLPYKMIPPSFTYITHQGGLKEGAKMSASEPDTAIFLSDSEKDVKKKINKSFSGGQPTIEEHRKKGGNPDIDKAYEILKYHHPDTKFISKIYDEYKSGKMLSGELKSITIEFVNEVLKKHQEKVNQNMELAKKIVYE